MDKMIFKPEDLKDIKPNETIIFDECSSMYGDNTEKRKIEMLSYFYEIRKKYKELSDTQKIGRMFHKFDFYARYGKMDMTKFNKGNLETAKKQYEEEKANEEVLYAKRELAKAENAILRIDRDIKKLEKEPFLETLKMFDVKKDK